MTLEKELINKSYYEILLQGNQKGHPLFTLGEKYMDEKMKEMPNFSYIRFAQGEVYFRHKDFEAAIFKWETIDNELKPWAMKNIADAHYEMELLAIAEDYYKSVKSDSVVLETEILLQLFSLYQRLGKLDKAVDSIKQAVYVNPDYDGVTEVARVFFEDYQDWGNAVELAMSEAIRLQSLDWFLVLEEYLEHGHAVKTEPAYFKEVLRTLHTLDSFRFESFVSIMWNSYKQTDMYFLWLKEINQLLTDIELKSSYIWRKLPHLYNESYFELISGKYLIRDISELIQIHLTIWMKVSSGLDSSVSSSATLAWNELFPKHLDDALISKAGQLLNESSYYQKCMEDAIQLYQSIKKWAEKEGLILDEQLDMNIRELIQEENIPKKQVAFKILYMIKKSIEFLIQKRVDLENSMIDQIQWNEELSAKLKGIHHQLRDIEVEKALVIKQSFSGIKDDFRQHLMLKIPELLRNCSEIVTEKSNFGKIHVELNEEMNQRIANYMEEVAIRHFEVTIQNWIIDCHGELKDSQAFLDEMSGSINYLYGEEKITLDCDFKVLDDWRRDVVRMTRGTVHFEKANIMQRYTPAQLLLKSLGKLIGPLSINNEKILNKYKHFIENADYHQIVQFMIQPFLQQLELFERSIARDLNMFFATPFKTLNSTSLDVDQEIIRHKDCLNNMRENPEIYRDPLTLFELKLIQYDLMNNVAKLIPEY
ncbi:hypothetical protein FZW96_16725 [Bacillus sp. BGMRC 2118]|nr:hypothetical protein FZW96_16725 [Bacillus sp. BGMRC 2118]